MEKYGNICKDLIMADDLPDRDRYTNVDILIGSDYYEEFIKTERIEVDPGMYLVNSSLGWMFSGRTNGNSDDEEGCAMMVEEEDKIARTFWDIETVGIRSETR